MTDIQANLVCAHVFAVASTVFFDSLLAFCVDTSVKRRGNQAACCWEGSSCTPPVASVATGGEQQTQILDYDDVVLQPNEPDLELNENVAYAPVR